MEKNIKLFLLFLILFSNNVRAMSKSKNILLAGLTNGEIKTIDVDTGKFLKPLIKGQKKAWFTSSAWHPNKIYLAAGYGEGPIKIWNTQNGKLIYNLKGQKGSVSSLKWNENGTYLMSESEDEGEVKIWDISKEKCIKTFKLPRYMIKSVVWHKNNIYIILKKDERLEVLGTSGKLINWKLIKKRVFKCFDKAKWNNDGTRLAFFPKDKIIPIEIWNTSAKNPKNWKKIKSLKTTFPGCSAAWSPNGRYLAISEYNGSFEIWDTKNEKRIAKLLGHKYYINVLAWSSDGKYIASGSEDETIKIWDTSNWMLINDIKTTVSPIELTFKPHETEDLDEKERIEWLQDQMLKKMPEVEKKNMSTKVRIPNIFKK